MEDLSRSEFTGFVMPTFPTPAEERCEDRWLPNLDLAARLSR